MPAHSVTGVAHLSSNSISNKYPSLLKTLLDTAIQAWLLEQRTHIQKSLQTVPTYSFALAQLRSSLSRSSLVNVITKSSRTLYKDVMQQMHFAHNSFFFSLFNSL